MESNGGKGLAKGLWRRIGTVGAVLILLGLVLVIAHPRGTDVLVSEWKSGDYSSDFTVSDRAMTSSWN